MPGRLSGQAAGLQLLSVISASPKLPSKTALSARVRPSGPENMPFEFPIPSLVNTAELAPLRYPTVCVEGLPRERFSVRP